MVQLGHLWILCMASGFSSLTSLSFRRNNAITAKGMSAFAVLVNLVKLDLERCLEIHGGLVHLKGISSLQVLSSVTLPTKTHNK